MIFKYFDIWYIAFNSTQAPAPASAQDGPALAILCSSASRLNKPMKSVLCLLLWLKLMPRTCFCKSRALLIVREEFWFLSSLANGPGIQSHSLEAAVNIGCSRISSPLSTLGPMLQPPLLPPVKWEVQDAADVCTLNSQRQLTIL